MTNEIARHEAIERMKSLNAQLTAARESALICSALLTDVDNDRAVWLRDEVADRLGTINQQVRGNIHSMQ